MRGGRGWNDVATAVIAVAVTAAAVLLGLLAVTLAVGVLAGEIAAVWGDLL